MTKENAMAQKKEKPIAPKALLRDRDVYRATMKRSTWGEKAALLDLFDQRGYLAYQRALHQLARKKGIEIWPAR
jgi:hypothetical protein